MLPCHQVQHYLSSLVYKDEWFRMCDTLMLKTRCFSKYVLSSDKKDTSGTVKCLCTDHIKLLTGKMLYS